MLNEEPHVKLELDNEKTIAVLHEEIFQLEQNNLDRGTNFIWRYYYFTYQKGDDVWACCYKVLSLNIILGFRMFVPTIDNVQ